MDSGIRPVVDRGSARDCAGLVLIAVHLLPLEKKKTFELWVLPAAGNPIPAGLFRGNEDSPAIFVRPGPVDNAAAVGVTVEPEGGSPQP